MQFLFELAILSITVLSIGLSLILIVKRYFPEEISCFSKMDSAQSKNLKKRAIVLWLLILGVVLPLSKNITKIIMDFITLNE